ncbi:insertion element protein [Paenibacillus chartarius]|uniref:Insertion element protein n=1 Tax=Paenibacillus chartarius TaxID=747481 RepID=A0ABV6DME5_9BACL
MAKLKRLATTEDNIVTVERPITDSEIHSRRSGDYFLLTPLKFANKYRDVLFRPVNVHWNDKIYQIQMNTCTDPFCKWFGLPQQRFETVKNKPSRYKLIGSLKHGSQSIVCNPDPIRTGVGMTWDSTTQPLSNWSIAEEIARLAAVDSVQDWEPEYQFHREACSNASLTPFVSPKDFYKQGKSSSNSQKWQCKACKKITNVLPSQRESFGYHQKRNDVLLSLALCLLNRTPVKRTCEILQIGSETYYSKLEWLYKRCLEFLERHETKAFAKKKFDVMWLNTDKMIYYLNNVRKRGQGNLRYDDLEDRHFATHIVVTSDVHSRYVFRSDVAYDWNIGMDDIENDTKLYKEDHLNEFARKNARLRFSFAPQPPTDNDTQTQYEYREELNEFNRRKKYIDGLHVNSTYTTIAHLWWIKQMVQADEWRFVTDEDYSIMTALYRVFAKEIRLFAAHHFLCKIDRRKSRRDAFMESQKAREQLVAWGRSNGYFKDSASKLAYLKLTELFKTHTFHQMVSVVGKNYPKWAKTPIEHPLPTADQGIRYVDCTTDLSAYEPKDIANMILQVNDKAVNAFLQQIRRRISILERPLVTARGEGKSYIYANFNPKYAQYAQTILRTFYNFCMPFKSYDGTKATPAQRIGITDHQFTIKDIIYFR